MKLSEFISKSITELVAVGCADEIHFDLEVCFSGKELIVVGHNPSQSSVNRLSFTIKIN